MRNLSSRVTSKGQVVIPKNLRDKHGIDSNTIVKWIDTNEGIVMVIDREDPILTARGMLEGTGLLKAYAAEKKQEKLKEKN